MMEDIVWMDTPRWATAMAQWLSCIVFILLMNRKHRDGKLLGVSLGVLLLEQIYLNVTSGQDGLVWLLAMAGAVAIMFFFIWYGAETDGMTALFLTGEAFLLSELMASLSWQLSIYPLYFGFIDRRITTLILIAAYLGLAVLLYFLYNSQNCREYVDRVGKRETLILWLLVLMVFACSNMAYLMPDSPIVSHTTWAIFQTRTMVDLMGMAVVYAYQYVVLDDLRQKDLAGIQSALKAQVEQYQGYEAVMNYFYTKNHEIMHMIYQYKNEAGIDRETWLDEALKQLDQTQGLVPTGNYVLDALLGLKQMKAEEASTKMTYVADGKLLDFLSVEDLCTIIGGGLDNAIAAETRQREDQRIVHLSVSSRKQFVLIVISNWIENMPEKTNVTASDLMRIHKKSSTYTLKSILYTVRKYEGSMSITAEENWFNMKILIPMADNTSDE